jgi:hypothetical protein
MLSWRTPPRPEERSKTKPQVSGHMAQDKRRDGGWKIGDGSPFPNKKITIGRTKILFFD